MLKPGTCCKSMIDVTSDKHVCHANPTGDPGNGKVIENCNSYSFHIHKILSILNVLLIYVQDKNVYKQKTNIKKFIKN